MKCKFFIVGFLLLAMNQLYAKVDSIKLNFDFRTKVEIDHGNHTLFPEGIKTKTHVASRARIGFDGYFFSKLHLAIALQDARTWGESSTTGVKLLNNIVYEAWSAYWFTPKIAIKIGRQKLAYDDERLIGGLDWAMQGRTFDALKGIFKLDSNANSQIELVATYNNDENTKNDTLGRTVYGISEAGETTKSLQILHYSYKNAKKFQLSAIAVNNVLQNKSGKYYDMITIGMNVKKYFKKVGIYGSAYYQGGKNTLGQKKSAYQISFNIDALFHEKFTTVFGTEFLSGRKYNTPLNWNLSFSPLYGTNHGFNGFMDYFYVGNHFNTIGLNDYYIKTTTKIAAKSTLKLNFHAFTANRKMGFDNNGKKISPFLGSEIDAVFIQKIGKIMTINVGQSFMINGNSMKLIKQVPNPKPVQSWTWVCIKFDPQVRVK